MKIAVRTQLKNREEIFKAMYVAYDSRLPILLIGEKGTAKTQSFLDFVNSINGVNLINISNNVFIRQLNFDTRAEDLMGFISIPDLKEGRIRRINGIQDAAFILLDEVDKASTSVRNLFLSLLRERKIFDGEKIVDCKWRLLVGTSNKEMFDEDDAPFLDRFVMKYKVERVGISRAFDLLDPTEKTIEFEVKEMFDEDDYQKGIKQIGKILEDIYERVSDRTLAMFPTLLRSLLKIYDLNSALINLISLTIAPEFAVTLTEKIGISKEVLRGRELANAFKNATDEESRASIVAQILSHIKSVKTNPEIARDDVKQILEILNPIIEEYQNV